MNPFNKRNFCYRFIGFEFDEIKLDFNPCSSVVGINSIELDKADSNIKAPEGRTVDLKFDIW